MPRTAFLAVLLLALTVPLAADVYIEYDHNADFTQYETWHFEDSELSVSQQVPRMDARIKSQIADTLMKRGRRPSNGDLVVTYHVTTSQNTRVDTMYLPGFGYGAGWGAGYYAPGYGGGAWGTSASTVTSYTTGTLIIDVYDAAKKELIWRGTVTDLSPIEDPDKARARVDKVMQKFAKKWEKMKQEDGIKTRGDL